MLIFIPGSGTGLTERNNVFSWKISVRVNAQKYRKSYSEELKNYIYQSSSKNKSSNLDQGIIIQKSTLQNVYPFTSGYFLVIMSTIKLIILIRSYTNFYLRLISLGLIISRSVQLWPSNIFSPSQCAFGIFFGNPSSGYLSLGRLLI